MKYIMIFIIMVFLHIVDDYYLQGILASMKQKNWWENQPNYSYKYKNDYIVALIAHAFSWSFIIMLPLLFVYGVSTLYVGLLMMNMTIHAIIDDLKCNEFLINLVQDQTAHILQIIGTLFVFACVF